MIQKFVDLVNETVDESYAKGIELFLENVNDEMVLTHKIINEGLETVIEQACSGTVGDENVDDLDTLTEDEIIAAMEELGMEE